MPNIPPNEDGRDTWNEWRQRVLAELERHDEHIEKLTEDHFQMSLKVQALWIKVGLFSAVISFALAAIVTALVNAAMKVH